MKIEKTNKYDMFAANHEQREISGQHVRAIANSIVRHGYIESKPIQVYKKNGKWVIVDGHHRFQACKALGIPVRFVIDSANAQEHMADENSLVRKWTLADFVRLYATRGNANYQKILFYVDKGIPLTIAVGMLYGTQGNSGGNCLPKIKSGHFIVRDENNIKWLSSIIEEMSDRCPACTSRPFLHVMSNCLRCDEFDREHFAHKLRNNTTMLEKTSNVDQMLNQVEGIYNFRSRATIPLAYLVTKSSQERKFAKK